MKKLLFFLTITLLSVVFIAGCGASEEQAKNTDTNDSAAVKDEGTNSDTDDAAAVQPEEPTAEDKCAFCNMKVYEEGHEMGAHTAQMVTADGEHVFFDDIGCLLNHEHGLEEEPLAKWVRDYNTKEWINAEDAVPVAATIKTPMKYGIALFPTEEEAKAWAEENKDIEAMLTTMAEVEKTAQERMKKKMEMMKKDDDSTE